VRITITSQKCINRAHQDISPSSRTKSAINHHPKRVYFVSLTYLIASKHRKILTAPHPARTHQPQTQVIATTRTRQAKKTAITSTAPLALIAVTVRIVRIVLVVGAVLIVRIVRIVGIVRVKRGRVGRASRLVDGLMESCALTKWNGGGGAGARSERKVW